MTPISHLHSVAPAAEPIDLARAQRAARELLTALGCDLTDESVRDTPRRMRWPVAAQVALFLALAGLARAPGLLGGIAVGVGVALLLTARWLEGWENDHEAGLLYEPGGAREGRGGYYGARGARRR